MTNESPAYQRLVEAINGLDQEAWNQIYAATRPRLIETVCDSHNSRSDQVHCESIVANALFDIAGRP